MAEIDSSFRLRAHTSRGSYDVAMGLGAAVPTGRLRTLLDEPRVADAPRRVWRDWALLAVILPAALLEGTLRSDLDWRVMSIALCLWSAAALFWRRTHPLAATVAAFGPISIAHLIAAGTDTPFEGLYSTAFALVFPYALFRWGSGREALAGLGMITFSSLVHLVGGTGSVGDAIGGLVFLMLPAALGLTVRYEYQARSRERDEIRLREREQLARELHDSVAHHVSAIAIQAQAGRTVATTRPEAASEALAVIEEAASRTLTEMRSMVGALRDGAAAELAPQAGIDDLHELAGATAEGPVVAVTTDGDTSALGPGVDAAAYRIAQEAITNARRHARDATTVDVDVTVEAGAVTVVVTDDGRSVGTSGDSNRSHPVGFGIVGMAERAQLLGGTFVAGPCHQGGWRVEARLPRHGVPA